jgi:hypothetical protein
MKTTHQHLLLLVGIDTLIYRKYYDTPPILVGHHYPAPPDFHMPGGWRLSASGIPIPLPPMGAALDAAIDEIIEGMSDEQRADLLFYPDNYPAWNMLFRRRYECELTTYDGP